MQAVPGVAGRAVTGGRAVGTAALSAGLPDPSGTGVRWVNESDLAVLVLQTSWALADAAHDLPAGRMSGQRREELADTLQALGYVLRVSAPEGER